MAYNPNNANGQATMANSAPVVIASDQSALVVASHAVTNAGTFAVQVTTINSVAPAFGTGVRGATVQRVTLATDDVIAVTQSGSWSLAANQSVNVAQMIGVTTTMGNGVAGTGVQRVAIASDNTPFAVKIDQTTPGTTNLVALAANQTVNVAQINGVTPLMGAGNTGTGSPRTTIATDQAAIATWGKGATGAAVPSGAQYEGLIATTANPSAATAGNLVGAMADKLGRQVVVLGNVRDLKVNQVTTITASTSETTVVTAVASTFLDVYGCIVENTSATGTKVTFKNSTAGTTQYEIYVPATDTRGFMLPSSDGFKQTTVNNNWTATCGTSVSSVVITMLYVKNI